MSNELIFLLSVLVYLGCVVLFYKLFGKNGLYAFSVFGTILGNIAVCKCVDIFGLSTTAGNVLYASTFLVTDILSENYGKKEAQKAVKYSLATMILWIVGTQLLLWFTPNANDMVSSVWMDYLPWCLVLRSLVWLDISAARAWMLYCIMRSGRRAAAARRRCGFEIMAVPLSARLLIL